MKIRTIKYYIKEAFLSIIRNRLMAIASMITVSCCIFVLIFSYGVVVNVNHLLGTVEDEMMLSVFVLDEVPDEDLDRIYARITRIEHVIDVRFISSEEAMENFGTRYSDDPYFLAGLVESGVRILPRTYEISVSDIIYQEEVQRELERYVGIYFEQVRYAQEAVETLISINNAIRIGGIVAILFLGSVSIIIIMNTIKLTVTSRQSEINIMQYVGATAWFIRWPFILEGMITGFLGALVAAIIGLFGYGEIIRRIAETLPVIDALFELMSAQQVFMILFPASLLLGICIGAIGSVSAVRRHLHV